MIIGFPRLVRLNPNIPWKTRGNGALAVRIGKKSMANQQKIGEFNGVEIFSSSSFTKELEDADEDRVFHVVGEVLAEQAHTEDTKTNPGFVLSMTPPDRGVYMKTVTRVVTLEETLAVLSPLHAKFQGYKNQRGLIGATAAIAWTPRDKTYEVIAYRQKEKWGTKRVVNPITVRALDARFPSMFDNYDYRNHHNRITPNSPCPILFGIRGDDAADLTTAVKTIDSEPIDSWLLFESNQGTDDHLQQKKIADIQPFESVITQGYLTEQPWTIQGGHVLFDLADETSTISCAAYEPTKEFRAIIRELRLGDQVEVYGGVRDDPLTINLEKIHIKQLASLRIKAENPVCPLCRKHMKSKGVGQGFKCRTCKTVSREPIIREQPRAVAPGFYEVPVCARRHLSKPLKRMMTQQPFIEVTGIENTR